MTRPPAIEAIRIGGFLIFVALALSAFLAWHWMNMRFEAARAELAGKVECFEIVREKMPGREGEEVPVPDVRRGEPRGSEPATEAPVRDGKRGDTR